MDATDKQKEILIAEGPILVTGGPGSGKTTVSIIKAAKLSKKLKPEQRILFLSFARATVARVIEAISHEPSIDTTAKQNIEVDTYHSFFWKIVKTHGYLIGLPRKLLVLGVSDQAVALANIRSKFPRKLSNEDLNKLKQQEIEELHRLAFEEGRISFDSFSEYAGLILSRSNKIRSLISEKYPFVILDEFQDTNLGQWHIVQSLGVSSTLIALADPEQRIFDFIGADPERINQFREKFGPSEFDLGYTNHRSAGTEIAEFGNQILTGKFNQTTFEGIEIHEFEANENQAFRALIVRVLQARTRLLKAGIKDWSIAILVPTKTMTRIVSDKFRNSSPRIPHTAAIDVEGVILAAEIVSFLMQPKEARSVSELTELISRFYRGKDGSKPTKTGISQAAAITKASLAALKAIEDNRPLPRASIMQGIYATLAIINNLNFSGDPAIDFQMVRESMANGPCRRLQDVALEAQNLRLLNRGSELRDVLSHEWRQNNCYLNALQAVRSAFIQDHFSTSSKTERGVIVMNMHKAKGKQFDEVIVFEGWPRIVRGQIVYNGDRFVRNNSPENSEREMSQARQNFRVSITRAKKRTVIMTPKNNPCLLLPENGLKK